jgi:hypothetical protein
MKFSLRFPDRSVFRRSDLKCRAPSSTTVALLARSVIAITLFVGFIDGRIEMKAEGAAALHMAAIR